MCIVYILYSNSYQRYYIGHSASPDQRFIQHQIGKVTSTRPYCPWQKVGRIEKRSRSEAVILERKLKNLNRKDLEIFLKKYFPDFSLIQLNRFDGV